MGHCWLIGMMGSGKSTLGRALADACNAPFVDTDDLVSEIAGRSVAEIWRDEGEAGFRARERDALRVAAAASDSVIATGGGAVLDADNVAVMRATGTVVWLDAAADVLAARVGSGGGRPLLDGESPADRLATLRAAREARYRDASHHRVSTDDIPAARRLIEELWTRS